MPLKGKLAPPVDARLRRYPPDLRRRLQLLPKEERDEILGTADEMWADPGIRQLILGSPDPPQVTDIAVKLLLGSANVLLKHGHKNVLHPLQVARWLDWIAAADREQLPWRVDRAFESLGIKRTSHRGRPKGRKRDEEYFLKFNVYQTLIERKGLWKAKDVIRKKHPSTWQKPLRTQLERASINPEWISYLLNAPTPRSLAIYLTAAECNSEYETVQRAVRRKSPRLEE